ncbi:hypothetical protein HDU76_002831 [Blyttiomyces sp. JEL0837]|nr:hypothetical protein HDU76_002831 [Blyttiomyces sp. JEL0837]
MAWMFPILIHLAVVRGPSIVGVYSCIGYILIAFRVRNESAVGEVGTTDPRSSTKLQLSQVQLFILFLNLLAFIVYRQREGATNQENESTTDLMKLESEASEDSTKQQSSNDQSTSDVNHTVHVDQRRKHRSENTHYLAFLAHEMRNPLHAVLGLADSCLSDFDAVQVPHTTADEQRNLFLSIKQNLQGIQSFGEFMAKLSIEATQLANLNLSTRGLELSVSSSSTLHTTFNLRDVLHKNLENTKLAMNSRNINFTVRYHDCVTRLDSISTSTSTTNLIPNIPNLKIQLDSMALLQLLSNIYANAMKFTSAGGNVNVDISILENIFGFENDSAIKGNLGNLGMEFEKIKNILNGVKLNGGDNFDVLTLSKGPCLYMFPGSNHGGILVNERRRGSKDDMATDRDCNKNNRVLVDEYYLFVQNARTKLASEQQNHHIKTLILKYLQISITDTGTGIPETAMETLFDPFTQASLDTGRLFGGSGLGLSIAKTCLNKLDGVIVVNSFEGVGTKFVVTIPLIVVGGDGDEERNGGGVGGCKCEQDGEVDGEIVRKEVGDQGILVGEAPGNSTPQVDRVKRILVVDDEQINRNILVKTLQRLLPTYTIDTATNGLMALRRVEELSKKNNAEFTFQTGTPITHDKMSTTLIMPTYDIIFMDIVMPIMDGLTSTTKIRKLGFTNIPIVATTANVSGMYFGDDIVNGGGIDYQIYCDAGFNAVVGKPFSKNQVLVVLERFGIE